MKLCELAPKIHAIVGTGVDFSHWDRLIDLAENVTFKLMGWTGGLEPDELYDALEDYRKRVINFNQLWDRLVHEIDSSQSPNKPTVTGAMLADIPLEKQKIIIRELTSLLLIAEDEMDRHVPLLQAIYGPSIDTPSWDKIMTSTASLICRLIGWSGEAEVAPGFFEAFNAYNRDEIEFQVYWDLTLRSIEQNQKY